MKKKERKEKKDIYVAKFSFIQKREVIFRYGAL
jgi:hypothetical protein